MIERRRALPLAWVTALAIAGCESAPPATDNGSTAASAPQAASQQAKPGPAAAAPIPAAAAEARARDAAEATLPMSIIEAQQRLTEIGYSPGPADGFFGPKTSGALRKFQRDHHLRETGTLDADTINALRNS
jgi:peptidoglycan hydrolase-like protein with peptidoglycan-binding domain